MIKRCVVCGEEIVGLHQWEIDGEPACGYCWALKVEEIENNGVLHP